MSYLNAGKNRSYLDTLEKSILGKSILIGEPVHIQQGKNQLYEVPNI